MALPEVFSTHLIGDPEETGKWVSYARALLSHAIDIHGGSDFTETKLITNADAVVLIRVSCVSGLSAILIHCEIGCFIGLEAGLVDLGQIAPSNPEAQLPGVLHTGAKVEDYSGTYMGNSRYILRGELDGGGGQESDQVGDGANAVSFGAQSPANESVLRKKTCAAEFPPSMLSGKARLWLQAVYGRYYSEEEGFPFGLVRGYYPRLTYIQNGQTLTIGCDASLSTGIFTTAGYEYFLLNVTSTSIVVVPMFQQCGAGIVDLLVQYGAELSFDDRTRLEAYALAGCYPDLDSTVTLTNPAGATSPIAYGWKFNWTGNYASVVSVTKHNANQTNARFNSVLHTLEFRRAIYEAEVAEASRWTINKTSSSTYVWVTRPGIDNIWVPDYGQMQQTLFWIDGAPVHQITYFNGAGPYYCYYGRDGTLKLVEFSMTVTAVAASEAADIPCLYDPGFSGMWCPVEGPPNTLRMYGARNTFVCSNGSGQSISDTHSYYENEEWVTDFRYQYGDILPLNASPPETPPVFFPCQDEWNNRENAVEAMLAARATFPGNYWTFFGNMNRYIRGKFNNRTFTGTRSVASQAVVVVPFYDCEAHVDLQVPEITSIVGLQDTRRYDGRNLGLEYWFPIYTPGRTYYPVDPQTWTSGIYSQSQLQGEGNPPPDYQDDDAPYNVTTTAGDVTINLTNSTGAYAVDVNAVQWGNLSTTSLANPVSSQLMMTRTSVLGDIRSQGITITGGYGIEPLNWTFAGWA